MWLNATFPEMEPSTVLLPARTWDREILNPFLSNDALVHPRLRHRGAPVILPEDGRIDGLIKVRLNYSKKLDTSSQPIGRLQSFPFSKPKSSFTRPVDTSFVSPTSSSSGSVNPMEPVTFLPPDFGRGLKLTHMDEKLFNFCTCSSKTTPPPGLMLTMIRLVIIAICGAVSLIPSGNCYLTDIAPIAANNECVKHAILALSATYILDYSNEDHIKTRANFHWKRAVHLLTRELNDSGLCEPGKEDSVVAALVLFSHNEVPTFILSCSAKAGHSLLFHRT
jgi:hypothetical protein